MKYLKYFENNNLLSRDDFNLGDIVICIDDDSTPKDQAVKLKIGNKYFITNNSNTWNIQILDIKNDKEIGYYARNRFIKHEYFEDWKLEQDSKKYNL